MAKRYNSALEWAFSRDELKRFDRLVLVSICYAWDNGIPGNRVRALSSMRSNSFRKRVDALEERGMVARQRVSENIVNYIPIFNGGAK